MQKAFERVLGGEYTVVIEEELSELKQSDRVLFGEPCAVLYRTDASLNRPANECENEDKTCYIVFLPSKESIICNKDAGAIKSEDERVKLISLNTFLEGCLSFNFTYLQLLEEKATIWKSEAFDKIVKAFKETVDSNDVLKALRYETFVKMMLSMYSTIKAGKIKEEKSCKNRIFLLYIICSACKSIIKTGDYKLGELFNKDEYSGTNIDTLKDEVNAIKERSLYNVEISKETYRVCKRHAKYNLTYELIKSIICS